MCIRDRSPGNTSLCVVVAAPRRASPNHTRPTGLSALPPPGPAMPVTDTATPASERASAPSAIVFATGSLTAPTRAISSAGTPSISVLASFE